MGENAWVQVPLEGQDPHELDLPAPSFEVTDAAEQGAALASSDGVVLDQADAAATVVSTAVTPLATWVALVLGAGGLALGALAFLRTRRTQG